MGTLGGSVAHADPAADYLAALFALEAKIKLASSSGERGRSASPNSSPTHSQPPSNPVNSLTEIIVPAEAAGTGTAYVKMSQPASGFAIVGVAARIRKSAQGTIDFVRIGITGVGPTAYRASAVEAKLTGTTGKRCGNQSCCRA